MIKTVREMTIMELCDWHNTHDRGLCVVQASLKNWVEISASDDELSERKLCTMDKSACLRQFERKRSLRSSPAACRRCRDEWEMSERANEFEELQMFKR